MSFSNINQLLDEYYFYLSKQNIKKNTVLAYYFDFKNYLDISEAVELDELFKVDYLREFINQSSISESTKKRRLASIKKAYYYLTQNNLIAKDIKFFSNLKSIKIEKKAYYLVITYFRKKKLISYSIRLMILFRLEIRLLLKQFTH